MHKIRFPLELRPQAPLGELTADPLPVVKGPILLRGGRGRGGGRGREREGEGRGGEGREGEGTGPQIFWSRTALITGYCTHFVTVHLTVYCLITLPQPCLSVCLSVHHNSEPTKRLNQSRRRLGSALGWAMRNHVLIAGSDPPGKGQF